MAFLKGIIVLVTKIRNSASQVTGLRFAVEMHDDSTSETYNFAYVVTGAEFTGLPAGAAAKRAALLAILKREAHKEYDAWVARRAVQDAPPLVSDPATDLGTNEFTTFTGEAPPL